MSYERIRVRATGQAVIGKIEKVEVRHARDGEGRLRYEEGKAVRHLWVLLRRWPDMPPEWLRCDEEGLVQALRATLAARDDPVPMEVGATLVVRCYRGRWRVDYRPPERKVSK